jgi:hypothetical protein
MGVTREQIVNGLHMYLDDYVMEDSNVQVDELDNVKKNFDKLLDNLREECEESEDDDE